MMAAFVPIWQQDAGGFYFPLLHFDVRCPH